jgi:ABC-type transporter Mla MlaB component
MGQNLSDPTLEEAAIRFANSDDRGAESVLMTALQTQAGAPDSVEAWTAALLDLYRGTGQRASFERWVQSHVLEPHRPAPVWFSTPEALGLTESTVGPIPEPRPAVLPQEFWQCPSELDAAATQQMYDFIKAQSGPYRLDWRLLRSIPADVVPTLAELFAHWCDQPLALHFKGVSVLVDVLRANTPVGVRRVAALWWQLRMSLCRILGSQEDFDVVAMEFCITYEVSPPAWQATRCEYDNVLETRWADADAADVAMQADTARQALLDGKTLPDACHAELFGEVLGATTDKLQALQSVTQSGSDIVVNCDRLIRVDFSAAGNILNWVATAQAAGRQVELRRVPRLVAAFFNLIGINEHARVTSRLN